MLFKKLKKRKHYKRVMEDAQRAIWDMELNVEVIKEGQEAFRRELHRLGEMAKAHEEKVDKLLEEIGIAARVPGEKEDTYNRVVLENIYHNIPEIELRGLNPEARDRAINDAAQRTRQMRTDWIRKQLRNRLRAVHGKEKRKLREKIKMVGNEILNRIEFKQGLESDMMRTDEKIRGKWSEGEGKRIGGLEQRIEQMAAKMAGGEEFIRKVKEHRRKSTFKIF